jgi:hypothetical protein
VAPVTVAGRALRGDDGTTALALASVDLRLGLVLPAVAARSFLLLGDCGGGLRDLPEPLPRFIRTQHLMQAFTQHRKTVTCNRFFSCGCCWALLLRYGCFNGGPGKV